MTLWIQENMVVSCGIYVNVSLQLFENNLWRLRFLKSLEWNDMQWNTMLKAWSFWNEIPGSGTEQLFSSSWSIFFKNPESECVHSSLWSLVGCPSWTKQTRSVTPKQHVAPRQSYHTHLWGCHQQDVSHNFLNSIVKILIICMMIGLNNQFPSSI
jgi:hypothetical protein